MRRERRWRYYCDFCGKGGCSGGHVARHERGCTANPNRACGMCKAGERAQQPLSALTEAARVGLDALRKKADGCPACILAAIRTLPLGARTEEIGLFQFKKESEEFWAEVNEAKDRCY